MVKSTNPRLTVRLPSNVLESAKYWAQHDSSAPLSLNDFVGQAVANEVARCSGAQIDVDHILAARIGQLAEIQQATLGMMEALSATISTQFGLITRLARGESFLHDDDDGELVLAQKFLEEDDNDD